MQTAVWRELLSMVLHPLPKSGVDLQKNMTLKERLERYLRNNHGWIASGDLQRLVMEPTSYTPQNVGTGFESWQRKGGWKLCTSAIMRITGPRKSQLK
jgi:hypothetical protein